MEILKDGVNNEAIQKYVIPFYSADSTWLSQFDFPNTEYITSNAENNANTEGIHSRGCGYSQYNNYYIMPYDSTITDSLAQIEYQIKKVEDLIVDEDALETSFEGFRFYDLMRVALRRNDPSYLAKRVYNRRGSDNYSTMVSTIGKDLNDSKNWFMSWKGKIGY
jgi:hypothetical protein